MYLLGLDIEWTYGYCWIKLSYSASSILCINKWFEFTRWIEHLVDGEDFHSLYNLMICCSPGYIRFFSVYVSEGHCLVL